MRADFFVRWLYNAAFFFCVFRLPENGIRGFLPMGSSVMGAPPVLRLAQAAWLGLVGLTLLWDWLLAPLGTGRVLLLVKLVPLMLPLRGILNGRVYTFQYCSMLVLAYFCESVMRWFDLSAASRVLAAGETLLSAAFFVCCLLHLQRFKKKKD